MEALPISFNTPPQEGQRHFGFRDKTHRDTNHYILTSSIEQFTKHYFVS